MADTRGQKDIFGLDIDKFVQGVEKFNYNFLNEFQKTTIKGDSKKYWTKNPVRLAALTSPSATKNVSPGSRPATMEVSWDTDTVYVKKYFVEGFLDAEDISDADIDVYGTTLRDITERIIRDRDIDLYAIMSDIAGAGANIQTFATTAVGGDQWDAANYAADIIKDFNRAIRLIQAAGFKDKISCIMDPVAYESLVNWLISGKGSSIPGFSSEKIKSGVVMELLNVSIKVSTEATTDYVVFTIGQRAQSYAEAEALQGNTTVDPGIGRNIRVWTRGIGYLTNPNVNVLVSDINTA